MAIIVCTIVSFFLFLFLFFLLYLYKFFFFLLHHMSHYFLARIFSYTIRTKSKLINLRKKKERNCVQDSTKSTIYQIMILQEHGPSQQSEACRTLPFCNPYSEHISLVHKSLFRVNRSKTTYSAFQKCHLRN